MTPHLIAANQVIPLKWSANEIASLTGLRPTYQESESQ